MQLPYSFLCTIVQTDVKFILQNFTKQVLHRVRIQSYILNYVNYFLNYFESIKAPPCYMKMFNKPVLVDPTDLEGVLAGVAWSACTR